jgi:hypothetical protein
MRSLARIRLVEELNLFSYELGYAISFNLSQSGCFYSINVILNWLNELILLLNILIEKPISNGMDKIQHTLEFGQIKVLITINERQDHQETSPALKFGRPEELNH